MLAVHWSANGLGDTGRHCPPSRVVHWAKTSPDQAGQLLSNQSFSFLIWEQIYLTFLFLVNLYRQAFAGVFLPCSFIFFLNISLFLFKPIPSLFHSRLDLHLGTCLVLKWILPSFRVSYLFLHIHRSSFGTQKFIKFSCHSFLR